MTKRSEVAARSRTLPRKRIAAPAMTALPILGKHGERQQLARMSFGKWKVPLSRDELAALSLRAEQHLKACGTLFGFIRSLLGGAADVRG